MEVADILCVDEYIQVTSDFARFFTEIAIQQRLIPLQLLEHGSHSVCGYEQLFGACAVLPQLTEDMNRDVRRRLRHSGSKHTATPQIRKNRFTGAATNTEIKY